MDRGFVFMVKAGSFNIRRLVLDKGMSHARSRLRALLHSDSISVLFGAHDALSAKLIEEAQFEGVWATSFGVSLARRCLPDVDLLTMTETLEAAREMVG